jgi:hypothetical protein
MINFRKGRGVIGYAKREVEKNVINRRENIFFIKVVWGYEKDAEIEQIHNY